MSKAYETLMRLQRWQLDEERRRLAALYREQERLGLTAELLERRRREEAAAAGGGDAAHAYPAYAGRVRGEQRRIADNLAEVDGQVAQTQDDVARAYLALKQVEIVRDKQAAVQRMVAARREQTRLDEVGLDMHRRRAGAVGSTRP